jgi:hypothetical protein
MDYQRTETDERFRTLLERVKVLDPDLHRELSDAASQQLTEYEERAVRDHGR